MALDHDLAGIFFADDYVIWGTAKALDRAVGFPDMALECFPDFVNFSNQDEPTLFWVGCAEAPKVTTYFNDVVISDKNGSFYATHQYDKDLGFYRLFFLNIFKLNTGHVYRWNSKDGYSIVPNSQGTWPNGIDMIDDDLYVNYRGNGKITKFSSNTSKDLILRTYLNGGPDNVIAVRDELWIGNLRDFPANLTLMKMVNTDFIYASFLTKEHGDLRKRGRDALGTKKNADFFKINLDKYSSASSTSCY